MSFATCAHRPPPAPGELLLDGDAGRGMLLQVIEGQSSKQGADRLRDSELNPYG